MCPHAACGCDLVFFLLFFRFFSAVGFVGVYLILMYPQKKVKERVKSGKPMKPEYKGPAPKPNRYECDTYAR